MATYVMRCVACGDEVDEIAPIGSKLRDECACGGRMVTVLGVGLHVAAAVTGKQDVIEADQRESLWDRSMPAYKRMRQAGLQPPNVDSAAELEDKVGDQMDINYRNVLVGIDEKDRKRRREKLSEASETLERHPGIVE